MGTITQLQMFYAEQRKIGEANEAFMWMVENGMTKEELAACIAKRPSLWKRFENWLPVLPSKAQ